MDRFQCSEASGQAAINWSLVQLPSLNSCQWFMSQKRHRCRFPSPQICRFVLKAVSRSWVPPSLIKPSHHRWPIPFASGLETNTGKTGEAEPQHKTCFNSRHSRHQHHIFKSFRTNLVGPTIRINLAKNNWDPPMWCWLTHTARHKESFGVSGGQLQLNNTTTSQLTVGIIFYINTSTAD